MTTAPREEGGSAQASANDGRHERRDGAPAGAPRARSLRTLLRRVRVRGHVARARGRGRRGRRTLPRQRRAREPRFEPLPHPVLRRRAARALPSGLRQRQRWRARRRKALDGDRRRLDAVDFDPSFLYY